LVQVGNFKIARVIGFMIVNRYCASMSRGSERPLRAARRTRDEQISSAHPLAVIVNAPLPHFA
jgi:hypothetical protein